MIEAYWQQQRRAFLAQAREVRDDHELLNLYHTLLEQMKIRALSSFPRDDVLRQQIALLFSQAEHGAEMLLARGLPTVLPAEKPLHAPGPVAALLANPTVMYAALGAGMVYALLAGDGTWRCALFFALALGIAVFNGNRKQPVAALPTAVVPLQMEYLDGLITRQAQLLDQHIADLQLLLQDAIAPLTDTGLDPVSMGLCQYAWACAKADYPAEASLYAAEKLLRAHGLSYVEYTPSARHFFDVMPTKNASRTVYPALMKTDDGTLASKGQYIEKT